MKADASTRQYTFRIDVSDEDSADALLAKKWKCTAFGRGGTRNSLYGLRDVQVSKDPEEWGVSVFHIKEDRVSAVKSRSIAEDFILACAEAGAGGLQLKGGLDWEQLLTNTREFHRLVVQYATQLVDEADSVEDSSEYRARAAEVGDVLLREASDFADRVALDVDVHGSFMPGA